MDERERVKRLLEESGIGEERMFEFESKRDILESFTRQIMDPLV